jgi:hypothetical protein
MMQALVIANPIRIPPRVVGGGSGTQADRINQSPPDRGLTATLTERRARITESYGR